MKPAALFLKKWPTLYHHIECIYFALQPVHLMESIIGTRAREKQWARRHTSKNSDWNHVQHRGEKDEWIKGYWDSISHSHRSLLLEKLSNHSPKSALEIGCNCGPNLYLLARKLPDIEIRGVDINRRAIQKGNELLASAGISNVKLSTGKADNLEQFQDKSFDIIFTDAVLIYIGRDKIKRVVQEMLRVARRALVFVEWHSFGAPDKKDPHGLGFYRFGCWERDYVALLRQFIPEEQISITKINEDIWPGQIWKDRGAIIEVILASGNPD